MSPSLMAYCTFISPPTCSASASSRVCRSSSAMVAAIERVRRQRAGRIAGMDAGLLDVLHDAGDRRVLAVGEAIDVDLDGVGEIAVDQQRPLVGDDELGRPVEIAGEPRQIAVELRRVVHDLHGAAAEHVGRPDHDRIADRVRDRARLVRALGDAALGLAQLEPVEQLLEAVAILGEVDGVGRGAEDRHVRLLPAPRRA